MSMFKVLILTVLSTSSLTVIADDSLVPALGQNAAEIASQPEWHLTITPDGKNLPDGSGTAQQGEHIFAAQCAACHGPAGIGGSALALTGDVGSLTDEYPEKPSTATGRMRRHYLTIFAAPCRLRHPIH